jgi:predicted nucleic acid-binding protein
VGFVVDASVTACWILPDESHTTASSAFDLLRNESAVVPALWRYEVRNFLLVNERRGRIAPADSTEALKWLRRFPIHVDPGHDQDVLLSLARSHALTIYDAAYLETAIRLALPLATLDKDLRKAAKKARVPLI